MPLTCAGAILLYLAQKTEQLSLQQFGEQAKWVFYANASLYDILFSQKDRCEPPLCGWYNICHETRAARTCVTLAAVSKHLVLQTLLQTQLWRLEISLLCSSR
jgi:hypothetical protein